MHTKANDNQPTVYASPLQSLIKLTRTIHWIIFFSVLASFRVLLISTEMAGGKEG